MNIKSVPRNKIYIILFTIFMVAYVTFLCSEIHTKIEQFENKKLITQTINKIQTASKQEQNERLISLLNRKNLTAKQKSFIYNKITKNYYIQNDTKNFLDTVGLALFYNELTKNKEDTIFFNALLSQTYLQFGAENFGFQIINNSLKIEDFSKIADPIIKYHSLKAYGLYLLSDNNFDKAIEIQNQLEETAKIIQDETVRDNSYLSSARAFKAQILLAESKTAEANQLADQIYTEYSIPEEKLTPEIVYNFILPIFYIKTVNAIQNKDYKQAIKFNNEYGKYAQKFNLIIKKTILAKELLFSLPDYMIEEKKNLLYQLSIDTEKSLSFYLDNFSVLSGEKLRNEIQNIKNSYEQEIHRIRGLKIFFMNIGIMYLFVFLCFIIYNKTLIDGLTNLRNRRAFNNKIKKFETSNKKYAAIMIDLDNFKKLNDTYGHDFGDKVLKGVSTVLLNHEKMNIHSYRYGGEELVIILEQFNFEQAVRFAEQIRNEISSKKWEYDIRVTASIGLGYEDSNPLKEADENMYVAKRKGKNFVAYKKNGKQYLAERRIDIRNEIPDVAQ